MSGITFHGIQYTAKTGLTRLVNPNSNLDGSGSTYNVITATGERGTLIKTLFIKSISPTTLGMVRLFVVTDSETNLLFEVPITANSLGFGDSNSFYAIIPLNYSLMNGDSLIASTQNADQHINIIAECLNWDYGETIPNEGAMYTSLTHGCYINTSNSHLDGDGDLVRVFLAIGSCEITSINIKALEPTTSGMIRLYITSNSVDFFLFWEVFVPGVAQNSSCASFECEVISHGSLSLESGFMIYASTENSEAFNITIEAYNWSYPP